jgi:hypothetical protein
MTVKLNSIIIFLLLITLVGCQSSKPTTSIDISQSRVTVKIIGGGAPVSGVVVRDKGGKYYVLTVKHVIGIKPGDPVKYKIEDTNQHLIVEINSSNYDDLVKVDNILDLALVEIPTQSEVTQFAKLSKNLSLSEDVSISGWRYCLSKNPKFRYVLNRGKILQILISPSEIYKQNDVDNYKTKDYQEGYRVKYTNPTISGMSGSPVFNSNDAIVAIHGKPGQQNKEAMKDCSLPLDEKKFGNNWGIPMDLFLDSNLGKSIDLELDNSSLPTTRTQLIQPSLENTPKKDIFLRPDSQKN